MKNLDSEQNIKCFIFSDDLNQIGEFFKSEAPKLSCKVLNVNTEIRNLRQVLLSEHKVDISRIDLLDSDEVFILARNYKKLVDIPEISLTNELNVIENLKKELVVIGMFTITELSREIPRMQNKKNAKYRRKTNMLKMLKDTLSKDFGKIL